MGGPFVPLLQIKVARGRSFCGQLPYPVMEALVTGRPTHMRTGRKESQVRLHFQWGAEENLCSQLEAWSPEEDGAEMSQTNLVCSSQNFQLEKQFFPLGLRASMNTQLAPATWKETSTVRTSSPMKLQTWGLYSRSLGEGLEGIHHGITYVVVPELMHQRQRWQKVQSLAHGQGWLSKTMVMIKDLSIITTGLQKLTNWLKLILHIEKLPIAIESQAR